MSPGDRPHGRAQGQPDEAGSERVGGAGGPHPPDSIVELCAFRVGSEDYVVDIRRVREVVPPLPIRPVPRAPEFVEGVVNLRGEVIPVVDVRRRFGLPAAPPTRKTRLLVAHVAGRVLALVVDAVLEVVRIPRSAIRAAPPPSGSEAPRLFLGVCGGEAPAAAPRAEGPGEPWAESPARGAPTKLRLLLNVKALLQPIGPEEMAAAREAASGGEGVP